MPFYPADDFIRSGGRLQELEFGYFQKRHIILDGKHLVVKLVIRHIHITNNLSPLLHTNAVLQAGADFARMSLLLDFRFPAEKRLVFNETNKLVWTHLAPSLLKLRLLTTYDALLSCLTTRAFRLEMCFDFSCVAIMSALHRFSSRHVCPAQLVSERRTNFIDVEKALHRNFESTHLHGFHQFRNRMAFQPCSESSFRSCARTFDLILQRCVLVLGCQT